MYVSRDFGQTWQSLSANLKGAVVKTLTEDLKNPDVLYLGTETGLAISTDRGRSWMAVHANLPSVRIDEVTLHPRDNAMILATHGRALWILDHLEPIQEYASAQAATTDARLFTLPPYAMYRRTARDRNYEFWGDQTFFGENPPPAAVISWIVKRPSNDVKLKIADGAGRDVREISGTVMANAGKPGVQSACWDLRVTPNPAPPPADGRGRGEGAEANTQPPVSPFGAGCQAASASGTPALYGPPPAYFGPFLPAGTYHVALVVDGKTVDTKPLRVVDDPDVALTSVERKKMFDAAMEIHALQPSVTSATTAHAALTRQVNELAATIGGKSEIPADVKSSFDALKAELAVMAPKLAPPAGRGFGGGGRGADNSLSGRIGQAKTGLISGIPVTEQTMRAYNDVKAQAPKAVAELNATIAKAATLSAELAKYSVTLTVPPPVKAPEAAGPKRTSSM